MLFKPVNSRLSLYDFIDHHEISYKPTIINDFLKVDSGLSEWLFLFVVLCLSFYCQIYFCLSFCSFFFFYQSFSGCQFLSVYHSAVCHSAYEKRLLSRINPSLLLKINLENTWTLQLNGLNQIKSKRNYLQKIIKGPASLCVVHWWKCLRVALINLSVLPMSDILLSVILYLSFCCLSLCSHLFFCKSIYVCHLMYVYFCLFVILLSVIFLSVIFCLSFYVRQLLSFWNASVCHFLYVNFSLSFCSLSFWSNNIQKSAKRLAWITFTRVPLSGRLPGKMTIHTMALCRPISG